jgi:hypothetical protein
VIGDWLLEYNELRPHRGLGMMTPAAFAANLKASLDHNQITEPSEPDVLESRERVCEPDARQRSLAPDRTFECAWTTVVYASSFAAAVRAARTGSAELRRTVSRIAPCASSWSSRASASGSSA